MKTLADLKRDLQKPGIKVVLKERFGKKEENGEARTICKIQTNSLCFFKADGKSKSWLDFPKATLLEYDGNTFKIFSPGKRELTDEEQKIRGNEPSDKQQEYIDAIGDGSTMFYRRKAYYREIGLNYLFGTGKESGKRLTHENGKAVIEDDSIKGEMILAYEIRGE